MDRALDLNDDCNIRLPLRSGDGGLCIEHGNGSGFVAIAFSPIDGSDATKRHGGGASGLDRLTQARLVVLELNDQMRVRGGRGLEGFF